jgi:hypothetical protein
MALHVLVLQVLFCCNCIGVFLQVQIALVRRTAHACMKWVCVLELLGQDGARACEYRQAAQPVSWHLLWCCFGAIWCEFVSFLFPGGLRCLMLSVWLL